MILVLLEPKAIQELQVQPVLQELKVPQGQLDLKELLVQLALQVLLVELELQEQPDPKVRLEVLLVVLQFMIE